MYTLSPDGRWLAVLGSSEDRDGWQIRRGGPLVLHDLVTRRRYSTKLPIWLSNIGDRAAKPATTAPAGANIWDEARFKAGYPFVFFGPGPQLALGPALHAYWVWKPEDSSGVYWTKIPAACPAEVALPAGIPVPVFDRSTREGHPENIVQVPTDGQVALHTIWVRPDGSQMELVRKNDAPLWVSRAIVLSVIEVPIVAVEDVVLSAVLLQVPGVSTCFAACVIWQGALEDLGVDNDKVMDAREQLREEVERRRPAEQKTRGE